MTIDHMPDPLWPWKWKWRSEAQRNFEEIRVDVKKYRIALDSCQFYYLAFLMGVFYCHSADWPAANKYELSSGVSLK